MTRYDEGRAFEYRVREEFKKVGHYMVRSAGSKGLFDLVAIPSKERARKGGTPIATSKSLSWTKELPIGIQCFRGKKKKGEIRKFLEEAGEYCIVPCIAWTDDKNRMRLVIGEENIRDIFKL